MAKLKYKLTNDKLFRILFTKHPELLKKLVSALLDIDYESIEQFVITNPEILPAELGRKFCRLDINMIMNGQVIDIEVQVRDEGNYPERSLYYWAKEFSSGLAEREDYALLPRTIIISILNFIQFSDPKRFHSEFQILEVTSKEPLTDKMVLHYFELKKLPPLTSADSGRELWLKLFKAETEEDMSEIEEMGVSAISETVGAYRRILSSRELRNLEKAMHKAEHDEAQAIANANRKRDELWQGVIDEKNAELAEQTAALSEKDAALSEKDDALSEKDVALAEQAVALSAQAAEIAELKAKLESQQ